MPIRTWISHKYLLTAVYICEHTEHWTFRTLVLCFSAQKDIQAMYVWRNTGVRSRNHICSGKAANITYFCVCVCACVCVGICLCVCRLTYATLTRLRRIIWGPLCLHHIFVHYFINDMVVWKKLLNIKCVFWFSLQILFETFLILTRI
jgi:hypothetical protein